MGGTVLILNGTSSAGKSWLVKAFQSLMETAPCLDAGLDKFLFMLPKGYLNDPALWSQVMEPTRSGPIGPDLIGGMHRSIAGLAQYHLVHADRVYDFEVDTTAASPEECARQLLAFLAGNPEPTAFRTLARSKQ